MRSTAPMWCTASFWPVTGSRPKASARSPCPIRTASRPSTVTISSRLSSPSCVSIIAMQTTSRFSRAIEKVESAGSNRSGPQLRPPPGGYRHAATAARTSSAEDTIGMTTPCAPASSAQPMSSGLFTGGRSRAGVPVASSASSMAVVSVRPARPCWLSTTTKSKPARPSISAANGEGRRQKQPRIPSGPSISARIRPR